MDLDIIHSCIIVFLIVSVGIIINNQGNRSCLHALPLRPISEAAPEQIEANTSNTIFDSRKLVGRRLDDEIVQCGLVGCLT